MNDRSEDDILEVMQSEKSRGRRPIDTAARKRHLELLSKFREALTLKTEAEFVTAIRALGLGDDPKKLQAALKIWRSFS